MKKELHKNVETKMWKKNECLLTIFSPSVFNAFPHNKIFDYHTILAFAEEKLIMTTDENRFLKE